MARIKYSSIVSDLSGSVGSATFQRSMYGNILRAKPVIVRKSTPAQQSVRRFMLDLQYAWSQLSPSLRRQWDQYISFSGLTINRDRTALSSGHSLFLKYNMARLMKGLSIVTDLLYVTMPPVPPLDNLYLDNDFLFTLFSDSTYNNFDTCFFLLSLSAPAPPSRSFSKQLVRNIPFSYWYDTRQYSTNFYQATFGRLPGNGDYIHFVLSSFSSLAPLFGPVQTGIVNLEVV